MLLGSQRQRTVTKGEMLLWSFGSPWTEPNHEAGAATPAGISDSLVSQSDCQHTRELLSTALEHTEPGCRRESHSSKVPKCPAPWALVLLVEVVLVLLFWAVSSPKSCWEAPRAAALAAFLRIPNTEAAGCLSLQQGWPR